MIYYNTNTSKMATIILNHKVKDYSTWKDHYNRDSERRTKLGLKELKVGVKSDDTEHVYIIWETDDFSVIEDMLSDPDLKRRMEEAGVISQPEVAIIL